MAPPDEEEGLTRSSLSRYSVNLTGAQLIDNCFLDNYTPIILIQHIRCRCGNMLQKVLFEYNKAEDPIKVAWSNDIRIVQD